MDSDWFSVLVEDGRAIEAPVHGQPGLRPLYAEFRDWAVRVGMPWLANHAQPDYPARLSTTIPVVSRPPVFNGAEGQGEYPGPELPLRFWQGEQATDADCSATAKLSRHGDDLYVLVRVRDDRKGAALALSDAKRHWRTDSVEIALDPRGNADDTSVTFKTGILPYTAGGALQSPPTPRSGLDDDRLPHSDAGDRHRPVATHAVSVGFLVIAVACGAMMGGVSVPPVMLTD